MEREQAYELCRKRAFSRWRGPDRYCDCEDIAHDAWLNWLLNQQMHPYPIVDTTIHNWWQRNTLKKRSIARTVQLSDEHGISDDPSGYASANEQIAVTLQLLMLSTQKQSIIHVATLLMQGYTPAEIVVENDYELYFVGNVRAKLHNLMSSSLRSIHKRNHIRQRSEGTIRDRSMRAARRRKYRCKTPT